MSGPPPEQFKLSGDDGFSSRSKDVFANLDALEQKHTAKERARDKFSRDRHKYMKDDPEDDFKGPGGASTSSVDKVRSGWDRAESDYYKDKSDTDRSKEKEEQTERHTFQAPRGRAPRNRFVPDYKRNPQKYTKYDLSDVSSEQMSNSANTAAAFDFLKQRQAEKTKTEADDIAAPEPGKGIHVVVFKKPAKTYSSGLKRKAETHSDDDNDNEAKDDSDTESDSVTPLPSYETGKFKMQEYVVGQKPAKKEKKTKDGPVAAADKVVMQHLFEDEYEEDD